MRLRGMQWVVLGVLMAGGVQRGSAQGVVELRVRVRNVPGVQRLGPKVHGRPNCERASFPPKRGG